MRVHRAADAHCAPGGAQGAQVVGIEVGGVAAARGRRRAGAPRAPARSPPAPGGAAGAARAPAAARAPVPARRDAGAPGGRARRPGGRGGAPRDRDDAAAQRVGRRDRAHDDAISGAGEQRLLQARLPAARRRGRPGARPSRACRGARARASVARVAQRRARSRAPATGATAPGRGDDVAAGDLAQVDPGQVERHALAGAGALDGLVVDLHRAHPHRRARRQQLRAGRRVPPRPTTACRSPRCRRP